MSSIQQLLIQRELDLQIFKQNKKDQEEIYLKNSPEVVSQITSSIFESIKEEIKIRLLNVREPIFEKLNFEYTHSVVTAVNVSYTHDELFKNLAKKTIELSPFKEWGQGIHYYTASEMQSNILLIYFIGIWRRVEINLTERLSQYKEEPGNDPINFKITPYNQVRNWTGIVVNLMLDLNQKKNNVPPAIPEDSGFWGFLESHAKKD